jgi:AcrR family transcriptional regulator
MPSRETNLQHWINTGYTLFAEEGLEALNVERLARVAGLSKSGFYHHFRDREGFLENILDFHLSIAGKMLGELQNMEAVDPDLLIILLRWKTSVLAHQQLVKNRSNRRCLECLNRVNNIVDPVVVPLWARFIGLPDNPTLAFHYYDIVRDMFYARLVPTLFTEDGLRTLVVTEAKRMLELLSETQGNVDLFRLRMESR